MRVLLHIGFPKAASSTLQTQFFARHPDICLLAKPRHRDDARARELLELLRFTDAMAFARVRPRLETLIAALGDESRLCVLSAEELSVGPYW